MTLQDIIHKYEVGEHRKFIPIAAGILLFVAILVLYNLREATGFASIEAMDTSQIARNLAQGEGFSTNFIRPLSLALVKEQRDEKDEDPMLLERHPDLVNAPLYPCLIAIFMKLLPFDFEIPDLRSEDFHRFQPERIIGFINQALFIACGILLFLLGRSLFDESIAWFSLAIFWGTDMMWRFSFSGLSTNLAMFLLLLLAMCLVKLERSHPVDDFDSEDHHEQKDPRRERSIGYYIWMAMLCGTLLGALMLTRYSLGWLVFPVILFIVFYLHGKRLLVAGITLLVTLILVSPWLMRNYQLSGRFFGMASYAHFHETNPYKDNLLEQTLDLTKIEEVSLRKMIRKYLLNMASIVEDQIPKMGDSWMASLFLVGLLVPFANRSLNRLRIFVVLGILCLASVQALGRSYLSDHSLKINSENHILLFLPFVYLFGAGLFFLLRDQLALNFANAHFYVSLFVVILACLPLIFRLLPPRTNPIVYPPYFPPRIQHFGKWFKENELMMSDMPWAMGWYADRQCLWLTHNLDDFYDISDFQKPIKGLYLTNITSDRRFASDVVENDKWTWGHFYMKLLRADLPEAFSLHHIENAYLPQQILLTDWPRWNSINP